MADRLLIPSAIPPAPEYRATLCDQLDACRYTVDTGDLATPLLPHCQSVSSVITLSWSAPAVRPEPENSHLAGTLHALPRGGGARRRVGWLNWAARESTFGQRCSLSARESDASSLTFNSEQEIKTQWKNEMLKFDLFRSSRGK